MNKDLKDLKNTLEFLNELDLRGKISELVEDFANFYPDNYNQICKYYSIDENDEEKIIEFFYQKIIQISEKTNLSTDAVVNSIENLLDNPFALIITLDECDLYQNQIKI